ncbi:MAG: hypothetical protein ISS49_05920 [Anaerolineae bacterium]|nr:hypothetical protein [Anaerolineae bacterium]
MPDSILAEILQDIHTLATELQFYERKYGVLSETFFETYMSGEEPEDDAWVPDFAIWAGAYQTWLDRQREYRVAVRRLRERPDSLSRLIRVAAPSALQRKVEVSDEPARDSNRYSRA